VHNGEITGTASERKQTLHLSFCTSLQVILDSTTHRLADVMTGFPAIVELGETDHGVGAVAHHPCKCRLGEGYITCRAKRFNGQLR
jgi:hypothetical protein